MKGIFNFRPLHYTLLSINTCPEIDVLIVINWSTGEETVLKIFCKLSSAFTPTFKGGPHRSPS